MTRLQRNRIAAAAVIGILAIHLAGIAFCTVAVAFPNIFKRYRHYYPELADTVPHEQVYFNSRSGQELSGFFFANDASDMVVLLCHGRSHNKTHELPYARDYLKQFNVLAIDFRSHGDGPYGTTSIGYYESDDVLGALDWLHDRGFERAAIVGHSMGGVAALKALIEDEASTKKNRPLEEFEPSSSKRATITEPESGRLEITALIIEGVYARLDELLRDETRWVPPTIWWPGFRLAEKLAGYAISDNAPEEWIGTLSCPVLILQADEDQMLRADNAQRLFAAAQSPKQVEIFDGTHDKYRAVVSGLATGFIELHLRDGD